MARQRAQGGPSPSSREHIAEDPKLLASDTRHPFQASMPYEAA